MMMLFMMVTMILQPLCLLTLFSGENEMESIHGNKIKYRATENDRRLQRLESQQEIYGMCGSIAQEMSPSEKLRKVM